MSDSSRRDLLKVGAGVMAGVAAAGGLSLVNARKANAAITHPFGYAQLDAEATRQLGYNSYKGIDIDGVKHQGCQRTGRMGPQQPVG